MNDKQIQEWIDAFYEGTITLEQEQSLRDFFIGTESVPEHWKEEQAFLRALWTATEIPVPDTLVGKLEEQLNTLAVETENKPLAPKKIVLRRIITWSASIAAVAVLAIMLTTRSSQNTPGLTDTYTDPVEAAEAVEQIFGLMSGEWNKGMEEITRAGKQVETANQIIQQTTKPITL